MSGPLAQFSFFFFFFCFSFFFFLLLFWIFLVFLFLIIFLIFVLFKIFIYLFIEFLKSICNFFRNYSTITKLLYAYYLSPKNYYSTKLVLFIWFLKRNCNFFNKIVVLVVLPNYYVHIIFSEINKPKQLTKTKTINQLSMVRCGVHLYYFIW